jgi:hypothetical protein
VTGHATVAPPCPVPVAPIEFSAQLLLVDSPLPTFFCFISCSVFVSYSSCANAIGFVVENIPVNAAAIKPVAMASTLFIKHSIESQIWLHFSYLVRYLGLVSSGKLQQMWDYIRKNLKPMVQTHSITRTLL